jgi:DNA-binding GntR family transcriptional regulator
LKTRRESSVKSPPSAHVHAYRRIKHAILSRELGAHEPLIEMRLAEKLGLSRTPVREALRLLESEGLVRHHSRKGWRIVFLSKEDLGEIFELKMILDPITASRAAERASTEAKGSLGDIAQLMLRTAEDGDSDKWLELDAEFHDLVQDCANNRYIALTLNNLNERWWRVQVAVYGMTGRMEESSREHIGIARAIAASDPVEAARLMGEHLRRTQLAVENALEAVFAFVSTSI